MTKGRDRRAFISATAALLAMPAWPASAFEQRSIARVILDNDYSGDPDGLFQLAHHVLCRSIKIPLIVGSHLPRFVPGRNSARDSAASVHDLLGVMGLSRAYTQVAGAERPIKSMQDRTASDATPLIVREAMRSDAVEPLIYAAGAGLTELALAWLAEPRIGKRLRLIWIGGGAHADPANAHAESKAAEFNVSIDPVAAQIIFNQSDIEIWQVPVDTYRTMLFGAGELDELGTMGPLGAYLKAAADALPEKLSKIPGLAPLPRTDALVLGDSPLVTLSALVTPFAPEPASSRYRLLPTPILNADGSYTQRPNGRPMRVYTRIDASLTFRDMMARFRMFASAAQSR